LSESLRHDGDPASRLITNGTTRRGQRHRPQEGIMKVTRRIGAVALLAASLAVTGTALSPATVVAADGAAVSTTLTLADACAKLAEAITFLEGRPASPLRDFLLAQARRLELRYCL
jgi:hypothetical protein